jgi:hypothetical protein
MPVCVLVTTFGGWRNFFDRAGSRARPAQPEVYPRSTRKIQGSYLGGDAFKEATQPVHPGHLGELPLPVLTESFGSDIEPKESSWFIAKTACPFSSPTRATDGRSGVLSPDNRGATERR